MAFASPVVQSSVVAQLSEDLNDSGDAALVACAAAGDGRAFRVLFERYAPPVRRFLGDLLRDAATADEATQETFVRAHARLDIIRDGDRVKAWLFGIARNVYLEKRRARGREAPPMASDDDACDIAVDAAPSPEDMLLGREADAVLKAALAKLRESRRTALLLRLDHGLPYEDIAAQMGWSLPKVKNEIHRGRVQLRTHLATYLGVKNTGEST